MNIIINIKNTATLNRIQQLGEELDELTYLFSDVIESIGKGGDADESKHRED